MGMEKYETDFQEGKCLESREEKESVEYRQGYEEKLVGDTVCRQTRGNATVETLANGKRIRGRRTVAISVNEQTSPKYESMNGGMPCKTCYWKANTYDMDIIFTIVCTH